MATTMTTIGYGDYSAAKYPDYDSPDNMCLIFFLQFIAIFTFSLIQDKLFSLHLDVKLNKKVEDAIRETEYYLNQIDIVLRRSWESKM